MEKKLTAGLLIAVPVLFNIGFTVLAARFDYPRVLQQPSELILRRFEAQHGQLLPGWYTLFLAAGLFIPLSALVADRYAPPAFASTTRAFGVAAGLVQVAGLARWVFLVPSLATRFVQTNSEPERIAVRTVFEAFHHYAGNGLGEHLGYLFTGLWSLLIAMGLWQKQRLLALVGGVSALAILMGLVGAGAVNALGYVAWSLWLITLGITTARSRASKDLLS